MFLFLAALYESWSTPFSVILAVPLGIFGALVGISCRSYAYDVYTQIGIVTLIGLAAKNAILIVEFAKLRQEEGTSIVDAAMEAAHLAAPTDSYDFVRIHPGRCTSGDCNGSRSRRAASSGHCGVQRHDRCDDSCRLYRSRALRGCEPDCRRRGVPIRSVHESLFMPEVME